MKKRLFAECFGTFALVFAGTGAIVINQVSGGVVTHPGIAITFGLVVLAMIYTLGDVSGAHLNPAVTTAFAAAGRFPWREVPAYLGAQLCGAFLASLAMRGLFFSNLTLGATLPSGPPFQSFLLEVILTLFLMVVILHVSTGAKEKGITAGIVVGAVIALEAMFAGPICGASMNPARSIAPAVVSGNLEHLWIYIAAPVLGALLAVPACCLMREPGCCCTKPVTQTEITNP
jgi:aquaporin Z